MYDIYDILKLEIPRMSKDIKQLSILLKKLDEKNRGLPNKRNKKEKNDKLFKKI